MVLAVKSAKGDILAELNVPTYLTNDLEWSEELKSVSENPRNKIQGCKIFSFYLWIKKLHLFSWFLVFSLYYSIFYILYVGPYEPINKL